MVVVVVSLVALACGGKSSGPNALSSSWKAPAILGHVPADTPYLIAALEPVSEQLRERMMRGVDHQLEELLRMADRLREGDPSTLAPWMRAALVIADELRGKPASSWWKQLGFDPKGRFALYGLSVWPVLRMDVAEPARLRSVIDRALAAAGVQLKQGSLEGRAYWIAGNAQVAIVASVLEREVVVAVLPTTAVAEALPLVLGTKQPAHSLAATATVPELLGRHRLLGFMLGYLDQRGAIDIVTGARTGTFDKSLQAMTGAIPAACKTDLQRVVSVAPRLAFGYRQLDESGFDGVLVVETPPSVVQGMTKLHAAVPGVTAQSTERPLFALGAAINPEALVSWLRGITAGVRDRPFTCPWFAELNKGMGELAQALVTPLPPLVMGVRGFSLVVNDVGILPPSVDGQLLISAARISELVAMATAFVPQLAGIAIKPDGRPVAIPLKQLGIPLSSAHAAMTPDRLIVSSGDTSMQRVTEHLAAPAPSSSPLFTVAFDAPRLQKILAMLGRSEDGQSLDYLGNLTMSFDVAEAGLVLEVRGTWNDALTK